ncbi:MAG: alkaline phosphatase D family protein [Candidatus Hydrogenedentes bacterium]|nr:alkaline phosphatase D family protein [Candidatus Hydrogenedentota bacterium]
MAVAGLTFAVYGEGAPRVQSKGYKKPNRDQIANIAQGKVQEAINWYQKELDRVTEDPECLYGLAVAYTVKGDLGTAMKYVKRSIDVGLPIGRYYAGPRNLLTPLIECSAFRRYAHCVGPIVLVHGPMLGAVTPHSARFKVRTVNESSVRVRASIREDMSEPIESKPVHTTKESDYTATAEITGLTPDTHYYYEVIVDGQVVDLSNQPSFMTYPEKGEKGKVKVVFGGGAGYTPWNERMWDTIRRKQPMAILQMGDNVYIDHPDVPEAQKYCYYRRLSQPAYRRFVANTPVYAIWDDHDFAYNDHPGGGLDPDVPAWKRDVWNIFRQNFNNPYYAGGEKMPGVWHDLSIGDVDFFMLDCRYYRTDATKPNPTMLGPIQKQWLLDKLKHSTATFKIIASSVPWAFGTKGGTAIRDDGTKINRGIDTWEGFPAEREEIFGFLEKERIEGVFLISADRHRSDIWKIERPNGYTLYDAMSSKLTNNKSHALVEGALFGYNEKCSFGLLTFDTEKSDPELTYQIINIEGDLINQMKVSKSHLSFKK